MTSFGDLHFRLSRPVSVGKTSCAIEVCEVYKKINLTFGLFKADDPVIVGGVRGSGLAPFGIFRFGTRFPNPKLGSGEPMSRKFTGLFFVDGV